MKKVKSSILLFLVNLLLKNGYVEKASLNDFIARREEKIRKRITDDLLEKNRDDLARLEQEHLLELEEQNAEIRHMEMIIADMKKYVKDAEKVYVASMTGMKKNLRISADLGYQVKKLMETSAAIYSAFDTIQQQAEDHKRDLIEQEDENRKLLRLKSK
jgi:hypothetical protein